MNMPVFKDNFSKQSDIYAKYRPLYPVELYAYLASLTEEHNLVWDCGTGNGQAAIGLTEFYNAVIATDPSEQQIRNSLLHDKVSYLVENAENNSIETASVDLLSIANALHWFDFEVFYKEVNRVLKPNGIIAAWCYGVPSVSPEVDKITMHFHDGVLGDYWQAENRLVEKEYVTIPFPFKLIESQVFYSEKMMTLDDFICYFNTWSATQRYINQNKKNPTEQLLIDLAEVWINNEVKKVRWKLVLKVGQK